MKPNSYIRVPCTSASFYKAYMKLLTPYHGLTDRETDVAARILQQYFRLKDSIPDPEVLKEVLWSQTSRKDIRESLGMSPAHFQMILASLKRSGFLVNGDINKSFIPHRTGDPRFVLQIVFDWSSPSNPISEPKQDK